MALFNPCMTPAATQLFYATGKNILLISYLSSGHISLLIVRSFFRKLSCWLNVLQNARLKIISRLGNHFNVAKGQLISKCPFVVFVLTKKTTIFFRISALASKKRLNKKKRTMPERIYNPITAMGFSATFTFQLDNTKR